MTSLLTKIFCPLLAASPCQRLVQNQRVSSFLKSRYNTSMLTRMNSRNAHVLTNPRHSLLGSKPLPNPFSTTIYSRVCHSKSKEGLSGKRCASVSHHNPFAHQFFSRQLFVALQTTIIPKSSLQPKRHHQKQVLQLKRSQTTRSSPS